MNLIWRFRLSQALKIAEMRGQPDVISALHKALREASPFYLNDWKSTMDEIGGIVDDMVAVMEWLRKNKHYEEADRVRTLAGRLARLIPNYPIFGAWDNNLTRTRARTYTDNE